MHTLPHHQMIADLIDSDLQIGDQIRFRVTSNSMQPLMKIGDSVVAEVITDSQVKRGDIIVIKRAQDFLTHRAISPEKDGWLTKGDSNAHTDPPIKNSDIIGQVIMVGQTGQTIDLRTRKWVYANAILAKLGELETRAISRHRYLRPPFRVMIKIIQKMVLIF